MWWGPAVVAQPDPRARVTPGMRRERDAEEDDDVYEVVARRLKRVAPASEAVAPVELTPPRGVVAGENGSRKRKDVSATGFDLGVDASGARGWLPSETLLDLAMAESVSPESAPLQKRMLMDPADAGRGGGHDGAAARAYNGARGGGGGGLDDNHGGINAAGDGDADDDDDDDDNAMSWEGTGHFARVENERDSLLLHENPYSQSNFLLRTLTLDRLGRQRRKH